MGYIGRAAPRAPFDMRAHKPLVYDREDFPVRYRDELPQYRRAPLLTHAWRRVLGVLHRAPRHGR